MKRILFALALTLAPAIPYAGEQPAAAPVWMMVVHEVKDRDTWRSVFDSGLSARQSAGELRFEITTYPGHPNTIIAIFQWDTSLRARAFVDDPMVRNAMQAAGVISEPIVTFHQETPVLMGARPDP